MRTFQTPKVFGKLTVRENLMMGCYRHLTSGVMGNMLRSPRSRAEMQQMHAQATEAGERFGSTAQWSDGRASAGGMQRLVELARAA